LMKSTRVDDRHRIVMPPGCPPRSAVTIQELDKTTWLVKRRVPTRNFKMVLIPVVDRLPDDPDWEKKELELAKYAATKLPPFEE